MKPELKHLRVKGLFGYLTYELSDLNSENSIFIIGNNGSGKSTIFNLIEALIDCKWHTFHEVLFEELSFGFQSDVEEFSYDFRKNENIEWRDTTGEWKILSQGSWREFTQLERPSEKAQWIFENCSEVGRANCGRHWKVPGNSHVNAKELENYYRQNYSPKRDRRKSEVFNSENPNMEPLQELNVQFIQANRLHAIVDEDAEEFEYARYRSKRPRPPRSPIYQISELLREKINSQITGAFVQRDTIGNEALNTWLSQDGDSESESVVGVHDLAKKIDVIENAFSEFSQTAQRTKLEIPAVLPDGYEHFLKFYLGSRLKQLGPLTDFLKQIDLFTEICNTAFGYKEISLHEKNGLTVRVNLGSHEEDLDLSDLSSGEQQIIFLAYQLTIGAKRDALILIDEPELSLHLEWQKTFVSLLERIGEQTSNTYLCATHSPSIVGSRVSALRNIEVNNAD